MNIDTIKKIVRASGVAEGALALVHFWGEDSQKTIANDFMAAVVSLGATPVLLQQARSVNRGIFSNATEMCFSEEYFKLFSGFDAVLDVFAYQPIILGYEIEKQQFELYRKYMANMFSTLMKSKRFVQIRIPTEENALESGLEPSEYIQRMTDAYDVDYDTLYSACYEKKQQLDKLERFSLNTGKDCKLIFEVSGREWRIDAGDGDWPCGEIYIAPNETSTEGSCFFEKLYIEDEGEYPDVTLYVEKGRIVGSSNEDVNAFIAGLSPESAVVCELGFGMNPNIKSLCGYTALDEKMAGTFHIAIGANNMFGGNNAAPIHMDFVGTGRFFITPVGEGDENEK